MHLIREGNIEQGEEGLQVEWGDAQADDKQSCFSHIRSLLQHIT